MSGIGVFQGSSLSLSQANAEGNSSIVRRANRLLLVAVDGVLDLIEGQRDAAALIKMSDRELKDIGLTRDDIGGGAAN